MTATMIPLPGDPDVLEAYVAKYRETAQAIQDASRQLTGLANSDLFVSQAVNQLNVVAKDSSVDTAALYTRYKGGSKAVSDYAPLLRAAQARARAAITAFEIASEDIQAWTYRRDDYVERAREPGPDQGEWATRAAVAEDEIRQLEGNQSYAIGEYDGAVADRDEAAVFAMSQLKSTSDLSKLNDNGLNHLGSFLKDAYKWMQEKLAPILKILKDVAKQLAEIAGFLALIFAVLSIIAPFLLPLAAFFATAATVLTVIAAVAVLLLAVLGKGSWKEAFTEVIGLAIKSVLKKVLGPLSKGLADKVAKGVLAKFTVGTLSTQLGSQSVYQIVDRGVRVTVEQSIKFGNKQFRSFIKDTVLTPLADHIYSPNVTGPNVGTPSWNPPAIQRISLPTMAGSIDPAAVTKGISDAIMNGPFRMPSHPILVHASGGGGGGGFGGR